MTKATQRGGIFTGGLALLLLFLWQGERAKEAILGALLLSARTIVPALLPSLMLSGLVSASAIGLRLPGRRLYARLFGLPEAGFPAFLLGALCGFPIGARTAAELAEGGAISREDAAEVAAISANSGPAFIVLAVGLGMLGEARLGWVLYGIEMASAVLLGILSRRRRWHRTASTEAIAPPIPTLGELTYRASLTMVGVVGTVCFFSALVSLLPADCHSVLRAVLASVLEVGSGTAAAARLPQAIALPLCAFAVCFSGVSVLLQSAAHLSPAGVPLRPLIVRKILQGLLGALFSLLFLPFL